MTPLHSPSAGDVSSSTANARTPQNSNHMHANSRKNANAKKPSNNHKGYQVKSPNRQTHSSNYAAPHTPIASAKRPTSTKKSASKSVQSAGRRSIGKHNNLNNGGHGLKDIREEQEQYHEGRDKGLKTTTSPLASSPMTTPIRKIQLDEVTSPTPINAATTRASQMSPMHPAKPMTHRDAPTTANTTYIAKSDVNDNNNSHGNDKLNDVQVNGNCNGGSGGVLSSIFSPVLNFLHPTNEDDQGGITGNGDDPTAGGSTARLEKTHVETETFSDARDTDRLNTSNCEVDEDRHHTYGHYRERSATDETDAPSPRVATISNQNAAHGQYPYEQDDEYEYDKDGDITMRDDDDGYGQHYHHEDDNGNDDADEDDEEEEEFNPYLFIKYLPSYDSVVPFPEHKICLPPKDPTYPPISLVLDLDETLVHCTVEPINDADMTFPVFFNGIQYRVHVRTRPFLKEFLEKVKGRFEVIVFTASQEVYASELLDRIDPDGKYIQHRMFRESCLFVEGNYLKDLNVLGRDLSQSVLVDNSPHAFGYQVDNGIPIESWFDDPNDTELLKLEQFLSTLHGVKDVRTMVRSKFQTYKLIRDAR